MEESMIPDEQTESQTPDDVLIGKTVKAVKRISKYGKSKGPALVIENKTEGWRVFSGSYKSDDEARADAAKLQKKRPDVIVKAGRWENWRNA
jgi:hypothetical protein